jgi:ribosome-associated toxin RatA of RatAB toxin-antitoxin module
MSEVRKSALVGYAAERMFDLIEAAEHYPLFLPWCAGVTVLARDDAMVSARIEVKYGGLSFEFATRNPKRRPEFMAIQLADGPFRHFAGEWRLVSLARDASRIEFRLNYEFRSALLGKAAGPVLDRVANTVLDAFVRRADSMYGPPG